MIDVRLYDDVDLDSVNRILLESFSITKCNFSDDDIIEVVACLNDNVVGYLLITRVFNPIKKCHYCLIDYVCVDSKYRNMGIGEKLINYSLDLIKKSGSTYAQLTCGYNRIYAHKLYEKCGFIKRDSDLYRKELL